MKNQEDLSKTVSVPADIELAKKLVWLMDDAFKIPVINKRVGLDPIIGLIPAVGDVLTSLISLLIVIALVRNGAPAKLIIRMLFNVLIDFLIGGIPIIGDLWDFFYQANRKNLQLLIDHHSTISSQIKDQ